MPHKLLPSRFLIQRRPAALEAIRRHYCDFGCSPSFAEISARIGVPAHRVGLIVSSLAERGEIHWQRGTPRSITLPRRLANLSTSELLHELQRRGLPVSLAATGRAAAVSAWPEATLVQVSDAVAKTEHDLLAQLDDLDGGGDSPHGQIEESESTEPGARGSEARESSARGDRGDLGAGRAAGSAA